MQGSLSCQVSDGDWIPEMTTGNEIASSALMQVGRLSATEGLAGRIQIPPTPLTVWLWTNHLPGLNCFFTCEMRRQSR